MARPTTLKEAKRFNIVIEKQLQRAAAKRAFQSGYSFSEYVSRLLVADMKREETAAHRHARKFEVAA
jgi:predicted HicB family RNase H-like nuclease